MAPGLCGKRTCSQSNKKRETTNPISGLFDPLNEGWFFVAEAFKGKAEKVGLRDEEDIVNLIKQMRKENG